MTNYITSVGVQQFSVLVTGTNVATGTATISAVGPGAFIIYGGVNPTPSNSPQTDFAYLTLTNPTTITATRNTFGTGNVTVNGCIIDGDTANLIKSIQYGTVTIGTATSSGTATISAVTNANTALHCLGWNSQNATWNGQSDSARISLSGTTVTANRGGTTGNLTIGFVVIEFQSGVLNQAVQNVSAANASSVASWTSTITSVNVNNSICFWGGNSDGTSSTNPATDFTRGALTNGTTVTVNSNTASANIRTHNEAVVEFVAGVLNSSVQRGTLTLTGVITNSTILSSVNSLYTAVSFLGNTGTSTTAVLDRAEAAVALGLSSPVPAIVHKSGGGNVASGVATTITSVAAGNTLVIAMFLNTVDTVASVIDNKGQTWVQAGGAYASDSTNNHATDIWYFSNSVSGVTSVTVTTTSGTNAYYSAIYEVSGLLASSPVDATGSVSNHASGAVTGPAITTTAANDFIVAVADITGDSVSAPYAIDGIQSIAATHIPSTTVTGETANFTDVIAYCSSAAAFKADTTLFNSVTVTKHTATANITASWEIFEFPAFSGGGVTINSWYPTYNAQINSNPNASQFSLNTGAQLFNSISQNKFYPIYEATVEPAPYRQQFNTIVMPVIPSPISQINWYPVFEATVNPFALAPKVWFTEAPLSSIAQNKWYPIYDAQVEPFAKASQFSYFVNALPNPISINKFYPAYKAEVIAAPPRASYSTVTWGIPLLAQAITINSWYPAYETQVKPFVNRAQYSVITELLSLAVPITNWYPLYDPKVIAPALVAKYSNVAQVLPTPSALLNWLPDYQADVKPRPKTAYSVFTQPPLISVNQNSWYPTYPSEVKRFLRSLDSIVVSPPIVVITPSGAVQIIWTIDDDIFTLLFS